MDILNIYTNVYITFFEVQLYNFVPMLPIFLGCIIRLMEIYFQYISETKNERLMFIINGKTKTRNWKTLYNSTTQKSNVYNTPRWLTGDLTFRQKSEFWLKIGVLDKNCNFPKNKRNIA